MLIGMIGLGRMGDRVLSAMLYAFGGHEEKKS